MSSSTRRDRDADVAPGGLHHVVGDDGRDGLDVCGGEQLAGHLGQPTKAAAERLARCVGVGRLVGPLDQHQRTAVGLLGQAGSRTSASRPGWCRSRAWSARRSTTRSGVTSLSTWSTAPRSGSSKSRVRASAPTSVVERRAEEVERRGVGIDHRAVGVERHRGDGEAVQQRRVGLPRSRDWPRGPSHRRILPRALAGRETYRAPLRVVLAWPGRVVRVVATCGER